MPGLDHPHSWQHSFFAAAPVREFAFHRARRPSQSGFPGSIFGGLIERIVRELISDGGGVTADKVAGSRHRNADPSFDGGVQIGMSDTAQVWRCEIIRGDGGPTGFFAKRIVQC